MKEADRNTGQPPKVTEESLLPCMRTLCKGAPRVDGRVSLSKPYPAGMISPLSLDPSDDAVLSVPQPSPWTHLPAWFPEHRSRNSPPQAPGRSLSFGRLQCRLLRSREKHRSPSLPRDKPWH